MSRFWLAEHLKGLFFFSSSPPSYHPFEPPLPNSAPGPYIIIRWMDRVCVCYYYFYMFIIIFLSSRGSSVTSSLYEIRSRIILRAFHRFVMFSYRDLSIYFFSPTFFFIICLFFFFFIHIYAHPYLFSHCNVEPPAKPQRLRDDVSCNLIQ